MSSMLKNGRAKGVWFMNMNGCSCHNSKADHRRARKAAKQAEKKIWKKDWNL